MDMRGGVEELMPASLQRSDYGSAAKLPVNHPVCGPSCLCDGSERLPKEAGGKIY